MAVISGCRSQTFRPVLDKQAILAGYQWRDNLDDAWFEKRIPFFEAPDDTLQEIYYYRWEVISKHLTYGSPDTGYMLTEFIDRPFWSGRYGGIACPLGHQMYEIRWLKDPSIVSDFSHYWLDTPGALPRNYSNWYADAAWATFQVNGDSSYLAGVYPLMRKQFEGWLAERYHPGHGLFAWNGLKDGMEVNINSRLTDREQDGGEGYRPTLNSYMIADARAISNAAEFFGDAEVHDEYEGRARRLRQRLLEELWDPGRSFFFHQFANDEPGGIERLSLTYETGPFAGDTHGRELMGYIPWQFNIPDELHSEAWKYLMDPEYFYAPYGPTTVEQGDPQFMISPRCCVWSGNSWPYATTQTLVAFSNLLNNYTQNFVDAADYREMLGIYARTHYKNGRPYIAEALHPKDGSWDGHDLQGHSEHYSHSAFVDLLITGLLGIRPSSGDTLQINPLVPANWDYFALDDFTYHGHRMSVLWDRTGDRYGRGPGFHVYVGSERVATSRSIGPLQVAIPAPEQHHPAPGRYNVAVNNGRAWPVIRASHSSPAFPPGFANDGGAWYHESPANRWTTAGSPHAEDWIALDFGKPQLIDEVALYLLDDSSGIQAPTSYRIEIMRDGNWSAAEEVSRTPEEPVGHRPNRVRIRPVRTPGVRAVFVHAEDARTGLTEIEVWTPEGAHVSEPNVSSPNLAFRRPGASASINSDAAADLLDGIFGMTTYQGGRWTARGTQRDSDWVQIELAGTQVVARADIYLWGRPPRYLSESDDRYREPRSMQIRVRQDGSWVPVQGVEPFPEHPMPMARNILKFDPVRTDAIRVHFEHDSPGVTGVTEIQLFGPR